MILKLKKAFLICGTVLLAGASMLSAAAPSVPKEIEQIIPAGMTLIDYQAADLNEDGKDDALIVVEKTNSKADASRELRMVMILLRKENDQLVVAEQNSKVYVCKKCLGSGYVNEQVLISSKGSFSVLNQGGSPGFRWTREYSFQYDPKVKTWNLSKVKTGIFDTNNNERYKTKELIYPQQIKKIKFSRFNTNDKWNARF
jgi:hypothetical protein